MKLLSRQSNKYCKYFQSIFILFIFNLSCDRSNTEQLITVEIEGAIKRPGKYNVYNGTTVNELINKAGLQSDHLYWICITHVDKTREYYEIGRTVELNPQSDESTCLNNIELMIIDDGKSKILKNGDLIYITQCLGL